MKKIRGFPLDTPPLLSSLEKPMREGGGREKPADCLCPISVTVILVLLNQKFLSKK